MVFRAVTAAPTAAQDVGSRASLLQHGHIILLKYWNASRICVSSLSRCYDNLCSNFNIYAAIATTLLLHYTQTAKSVALTNEALLVVALNYQLFAAQYLGSMARLLLHCHLILLKNQNSSRIFVTSLRRGHANLLFIVPILLYVLLQGTRSENTTHLRGKLYHQQRSLCLWWHETIGNLLLLFRCSPKCMQQALAGCILCQETAGSTAALRIVCITAVMLHCHWILLKIWSMSRVLMASWCRGHAIFLIIVSILIYVFPLQRHLDSNTPQFLKVFQ